MMSLKSLYENVGEYLGAELKMRSTTIYVVNLLGEGTITITIRAWHKPRRKRKD